MLPYILLMTLSAGELCLANFQHKYVPIMIVCMSCRCPSRHLGYLFFGLEFSRKRSVPMLLKFKIR